MVNSGKISQHHLTVSRVDLWHHSHCSVCDTVQREVGAIKVYGCDTLSFLGLGSLQYRLCTSL